MLAHQHFSSLHSIVEHIAAGNTGTAHQQLRHVLGKVDVQRAPSDVKYYIFGGALARRLSESAMEETNLYLSEYDVPQIHLFNLLAHHVPLVSLTSEIAIRAIAEFCRGRDRLSLIDVGVGTGRQMVALLELLARRGQRPERVDIVGIEPSSWSLDLAGQNVREAAARLGMEVAFHPVHNMIEYLSQDQRQILREVGEAPIINASFALHHIQDIDDHDVRGAVLQLLRSLDPAALILSEPNSDHRERDLVRRFDNCWSHFGLAFDVIDELPIEQGDKDALKVCFFGREISDILGNPEEARTERHESAASWLRRLRHAGFAPRSLSGLYEDTRSPAIRVAEHEGYLGLDYRDETVVALVCAVPSEHAPVASAELVTRSRPLPQHRPLDARVYMAALVAIAKADRCIHERERPFIESQARMLGLDANEFWDVESLDAVLARSGPLSERTREAILRDVVLLAMIDGSYVEAERAEARAIARRLGFDDDKLARTEALSRVYMPDELSAAPSWFRQYWLMGSK